MSKLSTSLAIRCKRFLAEERGATAIEYSFIAAAVAGGIVAVITTMGTSVTEMWTLVTTTLG
ncbi:MAG: Flp family type IVb pilin [Hyphomicrobiales bacterium]